MNDERPIEKLLRRYAKKRRDEAGAPPELHPATRRLLQGEVARQFPKARAEPRGASLTEIFALIRRRWVYAVAALAGLLIASAMILPVLSKPKSKAQFAKQPAPTELAQNRPLAEPAKEEAPVAETAAAAQKQLAAPPSAAVPAVPPAAIQLDQPALARVDAGAGRSEGKLAPTLADSLDAEVRRASKDETFKFSGTITNDTASVALATRSAGPTPARARDGAGTPAGSVSTDKSFASAPAPTFAPPASVSGEKSARSSLALAPSGKADYYANTASAGPKLETDRAVTEAAKRAPATSGLAGERAVENPKMARGGGIEREKLSVVSQSFANVAPASSFESVAKKSATTPVLASFQVEQTGDQVRVIDGDGSTYTGAIKIATASFGGGRFDTKGASELKAKVAIKPAARPVAVTPLPAQQNAEDYLYRVEGTNRTLNQQVVFTWNFVALTNALAESQAKDAGDELGKDRVKAQQQFPALLRNSAINGRAQINAGREIEIQAMPVTK